MWKTRTRRTGGRRAYLIMSRLPGGVSSSSSLLSSLYEYWKLDEVSGTRTGEILFTALTDNNTVTSAAGILGNAAQHTAANSEHLSLAAGAAGVITTGAYSLAGWLYADSLAAIRGITHALTNTNGAAGNWVVYVNTNGSIAWIQWRSTGDVTSWYTTSASGLITTGAWYHLALVYNGTTTVLYLNGVTKALGAGASPGSGWGTGFSLGRGYNSGYYWDGRLDGWGIWQKELLAAEVAWLYNSGSGREYPFSGGP